MKKIFDLVQNENVNLKTIRTFAQLVFEVEQLRFLFPFPVTFKTVFLCSSVNGYVRTVGVDQKRCVCVVLNCFPFLLGRTKRSSAMTWLYIYATVVHELEHIRLQQQLEEGENYDFQSFMASLCQYNHRGVSNWSRIINNIDVVPNFAKTSRRTASLSELICTQVGMHRAYEVLGAFLNTKDRDIVEMLIRSIDFLCEHMEIHYGMSSQPFYLFKTNLLKTYNKVQADTSCLERLKQLKLLFDEKGSLHTPLTWFSCITEETRAFYDAILIRAFLNMRNAEVWKQVFAANSSFHTYMEGLANDYCQRSVNYLKEIYIGETLLSQDILQDNAAMIIKTTNDLYGQMEKFGMDLVQGAIFSMT